MNVKMDPWKSNVRLKTTSLATLKRSKHMKVSQTIKARKTQSDWSERGI
jgi:hypothetical protein